MIGTHALYLANLELNSWTEGPINLNISRPSSDPPYVNLREATTIPSQIQLNS